MESTLDITIRKETIEKIVATYVGLFSLSPSDIVITRKNLEHMSDEGLYREIALIENFDQNMNKLVDKAAIETIKLREEEEKSQMQGAFNPYIF
jgi:hypothetical protein